MMPFRSGERRHEVVELNTMPMVARKTSARSFTAELLAVDDDAARGRPSVDAAR